MNRETKPKISFAEFELDSVHHRLVRDGEPLALSSKAFELLVFLAENAGRVLTKDEILSAVWENQFVEEANLTVQISALRKALGERRDAPRFLVTVPGKGYKFVGEIRKEDVDILFETRTLSRVVIEEETESENVLPGTGKLRRFPKKWLIAAALLVLTAMLAGGAYLWKIRHGANKPFQIASIKRLTTNGRVGSALALSPDGKLYAYSLHEEQKESLWLGHVDGGEPIRILQPIETVFWGLTFSPDGSSLYYTSSPDLENGALYKLPVFGGLPEKIRDKGRSGIAFAPDGDRYVYVRDDRTTGKTALVTASLKSADERELAKGGLSFALNSPAWSPDGETIAVGGSADGADREVYLINASDGAVKPLTAHKWGQVKSVKWLADGKGLIVVADEKDAVNSQLWQVSTATGEMSRLVTDLNLYAYSFGLSADGRELLAVQSQTQTNVWVAPSEDLARSKQITFGSIGRSDGANGLNWTADGRILYTTVVDKNKMIWTMDADGRNQKQLIPSGGTDTNPSASRDGRFIVFQSNRSGNFAIWRTDANGENLVQLTGAGVAGEPTISPDGNWVVYVTNANFLGKLYRIPATGGEPLLLTDKPAAWATISPDSRLIACGYETDGSMKLAILPIEGGEPLNVFPMPPLGMFRPGIRWLPDGKSVTYRDNDNGIWQQNLDGGEPFRVSGLPPEKLYSFGWAPDGKLFAFTRGIESRDIVLLNSEK